MAALRGEALSHLPYFLWLRGFGFESSLQLCFVRNNLSKVGPAPTPGEVATGGFAEKAKGLC